MSTGPDAPHADNNNNNNNSYISGDERGWFYHTPAYTYGPFRTFDGVVNAREFHTAYVTDAPACHHPKETA